MRQFTFSKNKSNDNPEEKALKASFDSSMTEDSSESQQEYLGKKNQRRQHTQTTQTIGPDIKEASIQTDIAY